MHLVLIQKMAIFIKIKHKKWLGYSIQIKAHALLSGWVRLCKVIDFLESFLGSDLPLLGQKLQEKDGKGRNL